MIRIIKSNFNQKVVDGLLDGCLLALKEKNIKDENINISEVPGAFEIPFTIKNILANDNISTQAIITLGCVIKGETDHYNFISQAVTNSIMDLSVKNKKPIGNGLITSFNEKQALQRLNNGKEAAQAVLDVLKIL